MRDITLERGLPVDLPVERLVLGAMILYPAECGIVALDQLSAEDFSVSAHQTIFRRVAGLISDGAEVGLVTLGSVLQKFGELGDIGGVSGLVEITSGIPKIYNLDNYCAILREKARLRMAILTLGQGMARLLDHGATLETLREIQSLVGALRAENGNRESGFRMLSEIIANEELGGVTRFLQPAPEDLGIAWPLQSLTDATGGFSPGNVTVIGAKTGGGKTTMACFCAVSMAQKGRGVAILSLEMTKSEVAKKLISQAGGFSLTNWLQGSQDRAERTATGRAASEAIKLPIAIDDRSEVTPAMLDAALSRLMRRIPVDVIIVDYLQLMDSGMRGGKDSREQHVAEISTAIKRIAKKHKIAAIVLTQLNDDGKVRESRRIEQDASNVLILEEKGFGAVEAVIRKGRFVANRRIPLHFDGATGRYFEAVRKD